MAKGKQQKKKRMKKYKQSYKSERQDYRQGGRVQKAVGGIPRPIDDKRKEQPMSIGGVGGGNGEPIIVDDVLGNDTTTGGNQQDQGGNQQDQGGNQQDQGGNQQDQNNNQQSNNNNNQQEETTATSQILGNTIASEQRTERIAETAAQVQAGATGAVPQAAIIPGVSEEAGTAVTGEIPQSVTTMVAPTQVTTEGAAQVAPEAVSTVDQVKEGVVDKQVTAATFNAITKEQPAVVQKAIMDLTPEVKDRITAEVQEAAMESPTKAAEIAQQAIQDSLTPEVKGELRPVSEIQPIAPKEAVEVAPVDKATAATRVAEVIGQDALNSLNALAGDRGVALEDLPEYKTVKQSIAQQGEAATREYVNRLGLVPEETAATREGITIDEAPEGIAATIQQQEDLKAAQRQERQAAFLTAPDAAQVTPTGEAVVADRGAVTGKILEEATAQETDVTKLPKYEVAAQRTAQVAEAATRIAQELGTAPSKDAATREAITSDGVAKGDAAQIGGVPTFEAASRQAVTKEARKTAAADMMEVVGEIPPEVTAAVLEDPATVEAQIDTAPVNVQAAVAALPKEALVSTQMEGLLAGMEEGKTPLWARPAVDAVNQMMAQRGLSASTVGRDALFNAIIQSALPIAQSNATALQQELHKI